MGNLTSKFPKSKKPVSAEEKPKDDKMAEITPFSHFPQAQSKFEIPKLTDNSDIGDVFSSESLSPENPISSGFFRMKAGEPLVYTYNYDEMKIVLEGDITIKDTTGKEVTAKPGDVFFFPKNSTITFTSSGEGLAFYCGQRKQSNF